jgi:excisionase family DNA binding protein
MPALPKPDLGSGVLEKARRAADRLRPSAAKGSVAADPQDVRALIDLVDAVSERHAATTHATVNNEVTPNEAATILGMSRPSVMRLIAKGELHPRMVHSRHKLSRAQVEALARKQTQDRREALANLTALAEEFDF